MRARERRVDRQHVLERPCSSHVLVMTSVPSFSSDARADLAGLAVDERAHVGGPVEDRRARPPSRSAGRASRSRAASRAAGTCARGVLSSGAGAHLGCGEGRSKRVLYARTRGQTALAANRKGGSCAQSLAGINVGPWLAMGASPQRTVRVLRVEDSADDAELLFLRQLRRGLSPSGPPVTTADFFTPGRAQRSGGPRRCPLIPSRVRRRPSPWDGPSPSRTSKRWRAGAARWCSRPKRARGSCGRAPPSTRSQRRGRRARVYGVNTGFGALSETRISAADIRQLQKNLVRSHSTGVGPDLGVAQVRGMMLLRAQVLALGYSGVRPELVDVLVAMLNAGVHPRVPSQGSVGASGDLAPLAHLALAMIGEGEAQIGGRAPSCPAAEAMRLARESRRSCSRPRRGSRSSTGRSTWRPPGRSRCSTPSASASWPTWPGAMSLEALKGSSRPFDERLHAARPHPGQAVVAQQPARAPRRERDHGEPPRLRPRAGRLQPPLHAAGARRLARRAGVGARACSSARSTRSPTTRASSCATTAGADIISGGNFHGQPLALALDLAAMAVAELANISERRVEQLVNPALSTGLTPFLAPGSGLHSGFMIAQVASASLVSENKVLCHPASVDSIPSSAGREDHVSMGSISARKLEQVVANVRHALAIEILTAAAGLDQRSPLAPSPGVAAAHAAVRSRRRAVDGRPTALPRHPRRSRSSWRPAASSSAAQSAVGRLS